ncbi:MAG TPA: tetratricopeptide repeat protein [Chthoniobacterales bacterium]|nr:tetratricopeptide repeat protein [Chthoniobacterales bacterium]
MKQIAKILPTAMIVWAFAHLNATGYYGPTLYLDNGGEKVDASPEFYWGLEVRRLAREFHPNEKLITTKNPRPPADDGKMPNPGIQDTIDADLGDFEDALKEGRIKPPDAAKATQQHKAARGNIADSSGGEEFDSEFADYHRGARAFANKQWDEARKAWEDLLKRPEQDRHYRTVWAAFMLGKVGLKSGDFQSATQWFQRTRELAAAGFADSLGLAADSYGWEGRSEWKQDRPEKAAPLFLTQLALGDPSAVVSLKALVPDRDPIEGMLNYGPEDKSNWTQEQKREDEQQELARLKSAARDPLLRRLVTVHILAIASAPDLYSDQSNAAPVNRCARWLNIIKQANVGRVADAEYLGWVAYNNGDYNGAAHWLEFSSGDTAAALWLKAKLQRRSGKLADAASSMAQAFDLVKSSPAYAPPGGVDEQWTPYDLSADSPHWGFGQSASGDLGGLRLARADFIQALDTLLTGRLWEDAAFVAERVLTTTELKKYVDARPATALGKSGEEDYNAKLRYLLGRRLVREDLYAEAASYLPPPNDKILQKYVSALKNGANEKLSKTDRAHAWFTAAWLARYDGMELMGTEVAPDGFAEGGDFPIPDLAQQRRAGFYEKVSYTKNGDEKKTKVSVILKPSKEELQRLTVNKIVPDLRFHYRLVAGALAIKAAELLPTDSEELADVVNSAGLWVKDRDEKLGDRYMHIIEQRCSKTEIGRAAIAKHWFVDQNGTWSTAEQQAYDALHKELSPGKTGQ